MAAPCLNAMIMTIDIIRRAHQHARTHARWEESFARCQYGQLSAYRISARDADARRFCDVCAPTYLLIKEPPERERIVHGRKAGRPASVRETSDVGAACAHKAAQRVRVGLERARIVCARTSPSGRSVVISHSSRSLCATRTHAHAHTHAQEK